MLIKELHLKNFRQFEGEQSFNFSVDDGRPVSLIFGSNGAGKTTLLNAFSWGYYGSLSDDVENQDRLISDGAAEKAGLNELVDVSVGIDFEHDGKIYSLRRLHQFRKVTNGMERVDESLTLNAIDDEGRSENYKVPQQVIKNILPQNLSRFFFFNGERIENLVKEDSFREVKKDVTHLLGLEQVKRGVEHLEGVSRKIGRLIKEHGDTEVQHISAGIEHQELILEKMSSKIEQLEDNLSEVMHEERAITQRLSELEDAGKIQAEISKQEESIKSAAEKLSSLQRGHQELICRQGLLALTGSLIDSTQKTAAELYEQGKLPSGLKRDFVDGLLEKGECICGNELSEGDEAFRNVSKWRSKAGLSAVEEGWQRLKVSADNWETQRKNLKSSLEKFTQDIYEAEGELLEKKERLAVLQEELKKLPNEDVRKLAERKDGIIAQIAVLRVNKSQAEVAKESALQEKERLIDIRSKAIRADQAAAKHRDRANMVDNVRKALQEIFEIRRRRVREELDRELKGVFSSISHQDHVPEISEDFTIRVYKFVDGVKTEVGKSTGENQILSLSFVSAVSKMARENYLEERSSSLGAAAGAGDYPIVMDAAFGSLDDGYQKAIAKLLRDMSPQLIILVSKSQGERNVLGALQDGLAHLGVIVTHTSAEDVTEESIALGPIEYPYIRRNESSYSELKEVEL